MGMEDKKPFCPVLDVDGVIAGGKQFDLDITLPDVNKKKYYFYFIKEKAPLGANSCIIKELLLVLFYKQYFNINSWISLFVILAFSFL